MNKIAILTSGGDSPGMNAAVRAVTRAGIYFGYKVVGIRYGYRGLINGDFVDMKSSDVSGIIQRGGTILKTARSDKFMSVEGRAIAAANLKKQGVDTLIAIGGDGTFRGATVIAAEHGIRVIGIPATIDNDLIGSDETIGYDTALNTAMEAIDKIRDTADAHDRLFVIEVMGRHAGFIALETGVASGAEMIILPEAIKNIDEIKESLTKTLKVHKRSTLIVVAEGDETGGASKICSQLEKDFSNYDMRVCVLGHVQRGGSPTAHDRVLASRLGYEAVKAIHEGKSEVMVGVINNKCIITPLQETFGKIKEVNLELLTMAKVLR